MIVDGVNFSERVIKGLTLAQFIGQCADVFWTDRDKATRKRNLTEVYYTVNPKSEKTPEETEHE